MPTTTILTYGTYTVAGTVRTLTITRNYTDFNIRANVLISEDDPSTLKATCDNFETEMRLPNQLVKVEEDGNEFFSVDPAKDEAFQIRCEITPVFEASAARAYDVNITGKLRAIEASGAYIPNWSATIAQSERITFTYSGIYTATANATAQENFANSSTGAEKSAEDLLAVLFPSRNFRLVESDLSEPQDQNDWIQFRLRYVEWLLPNDLDASGTEYDFSHLIITLSEIPIGANVEGADVGVYDFPKATQQGKSKHKTSKKNSNTQSQSATIPKTPIQKFNITGNIIVKSQSVSYSGLVNLWEEKIREKLEAFLYDYFISKTKDHGQTPKLEVYSVGFNPQESTITINASFVSPVGSGILEYAETIDYDLQTRAVVEYYLNGQDDYKAWVGKLPSKLVCTQNIRITSLYPFPEPPAPKLPALLNLNAKKLEWVNISKRFSFSPKINVLRSSNYGGFLSYTTNYVSTWQLVGV